jgi:hydrogenase nickel incorporation protein HypB
MCTTCGCGNGEATVDGAIVDSADRHVHAHRHDDGTIHTHWHRHEEVGRRAHAHAGGALHPRASGALPTHVHGGSADAAPAVAGPLGAVHDDGLSAERIVRIEQDILARNNAYAAENRQRFADSGIFALNLVSSPGSGKTTLLVRTIERLQGRFHVSVIEGDQQTSLDADRIRATGATAVQVNTGKGCHLDAHMVGDALERLSPPDRSLLFIENVGNLVCPAAFDLGEAHKVVILSVTEGEDKPRKYPDMFCAADLMLLNKIDLMPYVQFDDDRAIDNALTVRQGLEVIRVSATTGEGFDEWLAWLERGVAAAKAAHDRDLVLRRRVAELEAQLATSEHPV